MKLDALAKRVQKGDSSACAELVNQYGKMVYYTALSELDDKGKALDATKRVFREFFATLRKGDVPNDPIKHLQRQLRIQSKCLDSEDSIMDELMAGIQNMSDSDLMFGATASGTDAPATPRASNGANAQNIPEVSVEGSTNPSMPVVSTAPASAPTQAIPIVEPVADVDSSSDDDGELVDRDSAIYQQFYGQAEQIGRRKGRVGHTLLIILLVLLVILLIWVAIGFLAKMGIMGGIDLGYSWFNQHFFHLF